MKIKLLILGFAVLIVSALVSSVSAHTGSGALVKLTPSTQSPAKGETVSIKILLDTAQNPVNAAQINLSYPADKLMFVSIDSSKSQFAIQAENKEEGGVVKIARGSIQPVTGEDVVFADVVFSVKETGGISGVSVSPESMIVRSTDNKNIMEAQESGSQDQPSIVSGIAGFTRGIFQGILSIFSGIAGVFGK